MLNLDTLLNLLVGQGASDLHLKAFSVPHVRVDGILRPTEMEAPSVAEVEELIANILPGERREELLRKGQVDFAMGIAKVGRFRVHVVRQRGSLSMTLRHVAPGVPKLAQLGLPNIIQKLADEHRGLILVTGPRACGITTTIAAMVDHINETRAAAITLIEDPIEILHPDKRSVVLQREVGTDCASIYDGLVGALKHDPDVVVLTDFSDPRVVSQALTAANSGLTVIASMQTPTSSETIARIVESFEPHQQRQARRSLGTALRGVVSQRLLDRADGSGRVPAAEVLVTTNRVFDRIVDPDAALEFDDLLADGDYYGMQTFDQSLLDLYRQGLIGLREALAASSHPKELRSALQAAGLSTI